MDIQKVTVIEEGGNDLYYVRLQVDPSSDLWVDCPSEEDADAILTAIQNHALYYNRMSDKHEKE